MLLYSDRKLRLKRRLVKLQRAGNGVGGADGRDVDAGESWARGDAVVKVYVVVMLCLEVVRLVLGCLQRGTRNLP